MSLKFWLDGSCGCDRGKLSVQAASLGWECRAFSLEDGAAIAVVPNCARPFSRASRPCWQRAIAADGDADAKAAGFDIVPFDCLAARLKARLSDASRLILGWKTRAIDFGSGAVSAVTISWGDIFTASCSTGIPDLEDCAGFPESTQRAMAIDRHPGWLLRLPPEPADGERARQRQGRREDLLAQEMHPTRRTLQSRLSNPLTSSWGRFYLRN